ncbi:MAG: hypothetical protein ACKVUS_22365 [Saprospiraceae bacterium]
MKNEIKKSWQCYSKLLYSLLFLVVMHFAASATGLVPELSCPAPTASKTGQSSGSVSYSWSAVSGATSYQVWYLRKEDNFSSGVMSTGNTSITVSGLAPGTYRFYFATGCASETSEYIIADDLIML